MKPLQLSSEVKYAALHGPIHIPDFGQLKQTLTADATGSTKDLKMYLVEGTADLYIEIKGLKVLIPSSMVTHMQLTKAFEVIKP